MKPALRIQNNILAAAERRLLTWLSARMPAWVTPDRLTILGFCGSLISTAGYVLSSFDTTWLWVSIAGYFVNWFGDSLDGSLARFRHIERPKFGYFIDHSIDSFGNMLIVVGIGLSPFVRLDVALFALAAYLLLSIHTFLAARVVDEFRLSYLAAGPTELRLVLIAMSLWMFLAGPKSTTASGYSPFDIFVGGLGIGLMLLFVVQTASTARQLFRRGE
jgi:archaetidylinositol phosphate synthase